MSGPAARRAIHHLNCGTMCPHGARLFGYEGGVLARAQMVCHCLLIEGADGLTLLDTGFGREDVRNPKQLGRPARLMIAPQLREQETAAAQLQALGFTTADVRHIVVTHLDLDHAGGLPDFPAAEVHVLSRELQQALHPPLRERQRYVGAHWSHGPRWVEHEVDGEDWFGFQSVRVLPGSEEETLLVPLYGHTRGHAGVAVRRGEGWLLHCGDAYFSEGEVQTPAVNPPGLSVFQVLNASDDRARRANRERLRELASAHSDQVELICSHDGHTLARCQSG